MDRLGTLSMALIGLVLALPAPAGTPANLKARDVRTFQVLDSHTLVVTTWHRHQWRIALSGFCIDLEGAHTIGFRTGPISGEIDRFGAVLTRMARCPIREVRYIGREPPRSRRDPPAESANVQEEQP